jgi:hypothetical protein
MLDEFVDRLAGLDHQHDPARSLQLRDHLLDGMRAEDLRALAPPARGTRPPFEVVRL